MSLELKFIVFQLLIIVPFLFGYHIKKRTRDTDSLSKKIVRTNLVILEPPIIFWSIWGLNINTDILFLPLAGLLLVIAGFVLGKIETSFMELPDKSRKTFIISSSLANHGFTMGGFLCYLFIEEKGLGLSSIFLLYFLPYTFIFIFSYAREYSGSFLSAKTLRKYFINIQNMPLYSILAALTLHLLQLKRPDIHIPLDILIAVPVAFYYFTLGLSYDMKDIFSLKKQQLILSLNKFLIIPAVVFGILQIINFDHDIESVIIIQSFMPAAIYSVVTTILFDLDSRLASSLFVLNTLIFIFLIIPVLYFLHTLNII